MIDWNTHSLLMKKMVERLEAERADGVSYLLFLNDPDGQQEYLYSARPQKELAKILRGIADEIESKPE